MMTTKPNRGSSFNIMTLLAVGFAAAFVSLYHANSAQRQSVRPTAVAVINWLDMTDKLDAWKNIKVTLQDAEDVLKKEEEDRRNQITAKQEELKILPPETDAAEDATQELKGLIAQYQTWSKLQADRLNKKELHAQLSLYNKINDAVKVIAERDGWDIVLWNDSTSKKVSLDRLQESAQLISTRHVFYASEAVDISDTVTQYMNNMEANKGNDDKEQ